MLANRWNRGNSLGPFRPKKFISEKGSIEWRDPPPNTYLNEIISWAWKKESCNLIWKSQHASMLFLCLCSISFLTISTWESLRRDWKRCLSVRHLQCLKLHLWLASIEWAGAEPGITYCACCRGRHYLPALPAITCCIVYTILPYPGVPGVRSMRLYVSLCHWPLVKTLLMSLWLMMIPTQYDWWCQFKAIPCNS